MKGEKQILIAVAAVVILAGAFWMLLLSPKRDEASKLAKQIETAKASLAEHESEAEAALAAKQEFSTNYSRLVVLGKAVPADAETPSLLVQLQGIADHSGVRFEEISLEGGGSSETAASPEGEASSSAEVSPTEVAASTSPLGASVGPAGLLVMPYTLTFTGDFFHIANFIRGLDSLVKTNNSNVAVDGRLITVSGFSLSPQEGEQLSASFAVTTYLTPPEPALAAATPEGPGEISETATETATTIGGAP